MSLTSNIRAALAARIAPTAQPMSYIAPTTQASVPSAQDTAPSTQPEAPSAVTPSIEVPFELPSMSKLRGVSHGHLVTRGVNKVQDVVVDGSLGVRDYGSGFWIGAKLARAEHAIARAQPRATAHVVPANKAAAYNKRADLFARAAELSLV